MTKNYNLNKYLTSNPKYIAKMIYTYIQSEEHTIYIPSYWKFLMKIYNLIPKFFYKTIDKKQLNIDKEKTLL